MFLKRAVPHNYPESQIIPLERTERREHPLAVFEDERPRTIDSVLDDSGLDMI